MKSPERVELFEDNAGGLFVARGDVVIYICVDDTDEATFADAAAAWDEWAPSAILEFPDDAYERDALEGLALIAIYEDGAVTMAEGAHPGGAAKLYIGHDFVARTEGWKPTHRITFTSDGGRVDVALVMLCEDDGDGAGGPGYEAADWVNGCAASWCFDPDGDRGAGWYCEGQVTPGGVSGEVEVERIGDEAAK